MSKLCELLEKLEDTRNPSGKRYTLRSVMQLILAAMLAGNQSLAKIVEWGKKLSKTSLKELGFSKRVPCIATLSNILRRIDLCSLEKIFGSYVLEAMPADEAHIAIDGKVLRNSKNGEVPAIHLLSLFLKESQGVIAQIQLQEGENEISAAYRILEIQAINGMVISGDAAFAQKKFAPQ
jgi:hypothetical protein